MIPSGHVETSAKVCSPSRSRTAAAACGVRYFAAMKPVIRCPSRPHAKQTVGMRMAARAIVVVCRFMGSL